MSGPLTYQPIQSTLYPQIYPQITTPPTLAEETSPRPKTEANQDEESWPAASVPSENPKDPSLIPGALIPQRDPVELSRSSIARGYLTTGAKWAAVPVGLSAACGAVCVLPFGFAFGWQTVAIFFGLGIALGAAMGFPLLVVAVVAAVAYGIFKAADPKVESERNEIAKELTSYNFHIICSKYSFQELRGFDLLSYDYSSSSINPEGIAPSLNVDSFQVIQSEFYSELETLYSRDLLAKTERDSDEEYNRAVPYNKSDTKAFKKWQEEIQKIDKDYQELLRKTREKLGEKRDLVTESTVIN